jgi:hypothetical protein
MLLSRHHKGMKIAANDPYLVGEGYQTLPDTALPHPYAISPMRLYVRNLFSREGYQTLPPKCPDSKIVKGRPYSSADCNNSSQNRK